MQLLQYIVLDQEDRAILRKAWEIIGQEKESKRRAAPAAAFYQLTFRKEQFAFIIVIRAIQFINPHYIEVQLPWSVKPKFGSKAHMQFQQTNPVCRAMYLLNEAKELISKATNGG